MAQRDGRAKRQKAERRGRFSEWIAAAYLLLHGYRILALRMRNPAGEVDIIARKAGLICFVEVKARAEATGAVDAVSATSKMRIRAAADLWLARQQGVAGASCRFDIIAVMPGRWPVHFPDAF